MTRNDQGSVKSERTTHIKGGFFFFDFFNVALGFLRRALSAHLLLAVVSVVEIIIWGLDQRLVLQGRSILLG